MKFGKNTVHEYLRADVLKVKCNWVSYNNYILNLNSFVINKSNVDKSSENNDQ